ncbi:MAG: DNA polymerase III subunit epsilon [Pseudomonadota bacterium]
MSIRQIVLDTETTGLSVDDGHRIIEVGCVEMRDRKPTGNNFWKYVNPDREIDAGAVEVHGITNAFLDDKQRFHEIAQALLDYLKGAELIIHNASFDVGFLNREFQRCGIDTRLAEVCTITDTVSMARKMNPGQKANLDALCKRYGIDNANRKFHGALLDAQLLAEVYLAMTGGQSRLLLDAGGASSARRGGKVLAQMQLFAADKPAVLLHASEEELALHHVRLKVLVKKSGKTCWPDELAASAEPLR